MKELVSRLKEEDQDHEWYPTTREMLAKISSDLENMDFRCSTSMLRILDIGAGDGNALKIIREKLEGLGNVETYAIEKSSVLVNAMPSDIYIVGTDFHAQTLIDKKVDVVFCNPPYSEYEIWAERIIREANCRVIYLVIPERWNKVEEIQSALAQRSAKATVIYSADFLDSEYRKARAKVQIVRIYREEYEREMLDDPFSIWFDSVFKISADERIEEPTKAEQKEKLHEIVKGPNLIERLEELYQRDLDHLYENYRAIEKLDAAILKELHVDVNALKEGMQLRISGLKNLYWTELFDNLSSITDRLTKKSREKLLSRMTNHTCVDFTAQNAYAVVIWAVKNANLYLDQQLKEVYEWMSFPENVRRYKSNIHFVADRWRYQDGKMERYSLDYRLVFRVYQTFSERTWDSYEYPKGLGRRAHDYINDMLTIARNLGFSPEGSTFDREWSPGEEQVFTAAGKDFLRVRAFKNGNIHCRFDQAFIRRLNVEAGRLNGWIRSPEHAADEIGIPVDEVVSAYGSNLQIAANHLPMLSAPAA